MMLKSIKVLQVEQAFKASKASITLYAFFRWLITF